MVSNISLSSDLQSSPGCEADTEGPCSPHTKEGNKQKKKVKRMLKDVDLDIECIRVKQVELDDWIKGTEAMEEASSMPFESSKAHKLKSSFLFKLLGL